MYGRPLNLTNTETTIDGETIPMFVNRCHLLSTAFDELLQIVVEGSDFRKPLEVTFYGEQAIDLGNAGVVLIYFCLFLDVVECTFTSKFKT
jgi:hypothetical protein